MSALKVKDMATAQNKPHYRAWWQSKQHFTGLVGRHTYTARIWRVSLWMEFLAPRARMPRMSCKTVYRGIHSAVGQSAVYGEAEQRGCWEPCGVANKGSGSWYFDAPQHLSRPRFRRGYPPDKYTQRPRSPAFEDMWIPQRQPSSAAQSMGGRVRCGLSGLCRTVRQAELGQPQKATSP